MHRLQHHHHPVALTLTTKSSANTSTSTNNDANKQQPLFSCKTTHCNNSGRNVNATASARPRTIAIATATANARPVPEALPISVTTINHANPPSAGQSQPAQPRPQHQPQPLFRLASRGGITLPRGTTASASRNLPTAGTTTFQASSSGVVIAPRGGITLPPSLVKRFIPSTSNSTMTPTAIATPAIIKSQRTINTTQSAPQQQQQVSTSRDTILAHNRNSGTQQTNFLTASRPRYMTIPPGLAAPGKGGITLQTSTQSNYNHGIIAASQISMMQVSNMSAVRTLPPPPSATVVITSTIPLGAANPLQQHRDAGVHNKPPNTNVNGVYSSAGRASVTAHQQIAARRINSAPGSLTFAGSTKTLAAGGKGGAKYTYRKVVGGKPTIPRSVSMSAGNDLSPLLFLDKAIQSRGYSIQNFCSLEGAYYCKPTPLQKASYGIRLVQAIRQSDHGLLQKFLDCGISPNPCNAFGESILHMVCRRGDSKLLKVLLEANCRLQVTDDFGRTPLHDACWTAEPNFETVELILNKDERMLHIVDCRGSSPLSYIKREHWGQWIAFFQSKMDRYWPQRTAAGEEGPPKLCMEAPHSRPIPDPKSTIPLSLEMAQLLTSGKLDADECLTARRRQEREKQQQGSPCHLSATVVPAQ